MKCMDSIWKKDTFNSLFNFCGSVQLNATCGNKFISFSAIGNEVSFNIDTLNYGESCTYQVISQCGYPKIDISHTGLDVVVASLAVN